MGKSVLVWGLKKAPREDTHVVDDNRDRTRVSNIPIIPKEHVIRHGLVPITRRQQESPSRTCLCRGLCVLDRLSRALRRDARQDGIVLYPQVVDGTLGRLDDGDALVVVQHGQLAVGAEVDEAVAAGVDEVLAVLVHGVEAHALLGRVFVDGDDGGVDAGQEGLRLGRVDFGGTHDEGGEE